MARNLINLGLLDSLLTMVRRRPSVQRQPAPHARASWAVAQHLSLQLPACMRQNAERYAEIIKLKMPGGGSPAAPQGCDSMGMEGVVELDLALHRSAGVLGPTWGQL